MIVRRGSRLIGFLAALTLVAPLLVVSPAFAGGTITPAKTDLEESGSGWKLFLTIKLGKKPATAHQPVRFVFTPQVLYETFMDDSKPGEQTRNIPQGKDVAPLVETLDISFGDVQGNIWDTTKFDFVIRRERGFEAGEYKLELRDADDRPIGQSFKLKLGGKNTLIDRRAMVFAGDGKKKEKKDEKKDEPKKDEPAKAAEPEKKEEAKAEEKKDGGAQPPPPEAKPKGCGCQVPGAPAPADLGLVSVVAVATVVARRRRR